VPTVDAFTVSGLVLDFLSNDHMPPHFHATRRGEWEAKIYIRTTTDGELDFDMKWPKTAGAGPDGRTRRTLRKLVVKHRAALLTEFEQKVSYTPPSTPST
jgi:hypothetical protein